MRRVERLAALMLLAAALPLAAQDRLRPTGPVTIKADRAEWEKGGAMVYRGKVRLESGDLKLAGDRLQLRQFEDGQFEARVSGGPATLDHSGTGSGLPANRDGTQPPVQARADALNYDSRSDIVEIAGNALLTRGTDEIRGNSIRYDVSRRRIEAAGGQGGQVQIVIQPPPRSSSAPAPGGKRP